MVLRFYNTRTKKKEEFKPIKQNEVSFYSCGPTVYNFAHIGNLRTYIFNDLLKRTLLFNDFKVKHVMNITDVGHLTDDNDDGEDKMEKGAKREGKSVWEIARYYEDAFKKDISKLNIIEPNIWARATEHIDDMVNVIEKIRDNGYTYQSGKNVYFNTSKFKSYADFARLDLENLKEGKRTNVDSNKKNFTDFVLWFSLGGSKFGEKHSMKWDSPFGCGYPGWHIECTTMSSKYLGNHFDIHTGGIDHIPVHHTNEIAQAEAAYGVHPWVNYWLHGAFLVVDKGKMAKSGNNFLRLKVLEDKDYDPLVYRYFCLMTHYRKELKFTWEGLEAAKNGFLRMKNKIIQLKNNIDFSNENKDVKTLKNFDSTKKSNLVIEKIKTEFREAINDDLNIPVALSIFLKLLNNEDANDDLKYSVLLDFDEVLGLGIENFEKETLEISENDRILLKKRNDARKNKDFDTADKIRDEFRKRGFKIIDQKDESYLEPL